MERQKKKKWWTIFPQNTLQKNALNAIKVIKKIKNIEKVKVIKRSQKHYKPRMYYARVMKLIQYFFV